MSRHIFQSSFVDQRGNAVQSGNITVYLAGTTNLATIYSAVSGGSAVTDSVVTSDNSGNYSFFVDTNDYNFTQLFKTIHSKSTFVSVPRDYIEIIPTDTAFQVEHTAATGKHSDVTVTTITVPNTGLHLLDTNASHDLIIKPGSDLSGGDKTLTLFTGNSNRSFTISGDFTVGATNGGALDFSAPSKTLTVADNNTIIKGLNELYLGYLNRPKFTFSSTTAILIDPGVYHHSGTAAQIAAWNSQLTFTFGSGGSNTGSTDLGASEWHYLYLDDSAIVTAETNILTASEFLNSTTAPTYSVAKHGWYNGSDRCIFAVLTDGSNNVLKFYNDGDLVAYDADFADAAGITPSDTFTDVTLTIPSLGVLRAEIVASVVADTQTNIILRYRPNGSTEAAPVIVGSVGSSGEINTQSIVAITDSAQKIEVGFDAATAASVVSILTFGWHLPTGM